MRDAGWGDAGYGMRRCSVGVLLPRSGEPTPRVERERLAQSRERGIVSSACGSRFGELEPVRGRLGGALNQGELFCGIAGLRVALATYRCEGSPSCAGSARRRLGALPRMSAAR
jgi:hypothetical protein